MGDGVLMAGAGKKTFSPGETLLASDVNNFLMDQTVMVFDSASDRSTDLPTPSEGMVSYLKDVDRYDKYTGSGWVEFVATTLEDLTDTDISSPASNEFLRYDGIDWVNTAADATTSTPGVVLGTTSDGNNTALGDGAFGSNTTGTQNTASGYYALRDNTTGSFNTASGLQALQSNTTGNYNTASGRLALQSNTTGNNNTAVGRQADSSSATASNQVTLGNGSITSLRCNQTSISSLSDVRDKTNIETTTLGLDVINQVRPVEFTWARRDGTMGDTPDLGFIAQELAQVEDDLGETDRLRLTLRDNPEKLEASPNRLLPVLVKAVQELSAQNDELRARLDAVEAN